MFKTCTASTRNVGIIFKEWQNVTEEAGENGANANTKYISLRKKQEKEEERREESSLSKLQQSSLHPKTDTIVKNDKLTIIIS